MARVITSRSACRSYVEDPRAFASSFGLDDVEAESLVNMRDDLATLAPSFVTKRQRTLRWNAQRTLGLLGTDGDALVAEFVDVHPASEDFAEEAASFCDFVVRRTAELAGTHPHGQLIAELARFEQLRSAAFWRSWGPLWPAPVAPADVRGDESFDADRPLRLVASAGLGRFDWDLRHVRRFNADSLGAMRPDPCVLLFFHNGQADGIRTLRLREGEAAAVVVVSEHPEGVTARAAGQDLAADVPTERVLGKLLWQGALEWV